MACRILLLLLATWLAVLSACDTVPYTERKQVIVIPQNQERAMGARAAREILRTVRLADDPKLVAAVSRVGRRIAAASDAPDMDWEFHVIDDDRVANAFCLPGGKIFVYSGILRVARDEDELAAVMAHEVAHALARHGAERATLELGAQLGGALVALALGDEDPRLAEIASRIWGYGTNLGLVLPYGRKQEYEADAIGLRLMDKAGCDMEGAARFWENMRRADAPKPLSAFLSTHPTDEKRLERIRRDIREIRATRQKAREAAPLRP
ncbi:M48 family metallopeptidase [Solidesulfovibrio sp.]|uniref:M48 family metallopeptidase n=1 Tax=Solidesulfovibrio sp. TaxID=2910990 RepID=UPI00260162AE|nr:M48 family metallopeptidase [Solidesulfovibrio sp.]